MFTKPLKTDYPPKEKPLMIWDGQCGFCAYWVVRWQKITGNKVDFIPYQEVSEDFPDINTHTFKQASHLIETNGRVFTGPGSAYRTLSYKKRWAFLDRWYEENKAFQRLSDKLYSYIAKHRPFFFRLTKFLYGSDPRQVRPFWAIYLIVILYIIYINVR